MRVQSWIDEYTREAKPCLDVTPFVTQTGISENVWVDNKPIGIFVYTAQRRYYVCTYPMDKTKLQT